MFINTSVNRFIPFFVFLLSTFFLTFCTLKKTSPDYLTPQDIENRALDLCRDTSPKTVFVCGDLIKVTTHLAEGFSTYYKPDGPQVDYPPCFLMILVSNLMI